MCHVLPFSCCSKFNTKGFCAKKYVCSRYKQSPSTSTGSIFLGDGNASFGDDGACPGGDDGSVGGGDDGICGGDEGFRGELGGENTRGDGI